MNFTNFTILINNQQFDKFNHIVDDESDSSILFLNDKLSFQFSIEKYHYNDINNNIRYMILKNSGMKYINKYINSYTYYLLY